MLKLIFLSVAIFVSTNIDDIFVLIAFFTDRQFRLHQIVLGQYLGIAALFLFSVVASLVSLVLPEDVVGLMGFLPILIGITRFVAYVRGGGGEGAPTVSTSAAILAVAAATIANGGDNIAVYTPAFAGRSALELAGIAACFAILTAVWLVFANWLVNHPQLGHPIRRYGQPLVPFVLIAIGLMVLHDAGSFVLLARQFG
jgi:cadmium resistance protein CadD (predicted permease)